MIHTVEPAAQAFLKALKEKGGPPIQDRKIDASRLGLVELQSGSSFKLPVDAEDRTIPRGPNGQIAVRILRPQGHPQALPVILYLHGGGWVLGGKETHDRLVRELAHGVKAVVVFVEYSRSPEARYPVALEESYAVAEWISENAKTLNVDVARMSVAGDSAGGNMAAALTLLAKERGKPSIFYQILFYPVTDADFDTPSYREFSDGFHLTRDAMKWFWDQYAPDLSTRVQPLASPLRASVEQLRGLPRALIMTAECDVLRDEGEAYARKLIEADVQVTAVRYVGTIHDFAMLNVLASSSATRAAMAQTIETLRRVFSA